MIGMGPYIYVCILYVIKKVFEWHFSSRLNVNDEHVCLPWKTSLYTSSTTVSSRNAFLIEYMKDFLFNIHLALFIEG